jgi:hypothetical protein
MHRCRNSENFPVIEIVQSPSAKKLTANFLSSLYHPVSSVLESLSDHGNHEFAEIIKVLETICKKSEFGLKRGYNNRKYIGSGK